jgi:hypothetical protein
MIFRTLLGIDIIAALIVACFFVIGLADGSVSSFNMQLWLGCLTGIVAVLVGGLLLNAKGKTILAIVVLLILAAPSAIYGLFILSIIIFPASWN